MLELVIRFIPWDAHHHFRGPFLDGRDYFLLRIELIFRILQWPLPMPEVHLGFDFLPDEMNLEDAAEPL
jgi:hypothetical protein